MVPSVPVDIRALKWRKRIHANAASTLIRSDIGSVPDPVALEASMSSYSSNRTAKCHDTAAAKSIGKCLQMKSIRFELKIEIKRFVRNLPSSVPLDVGERIRSVVVASLFCRIGSVGDTFVWYWFKSVVLTMYVSPFLFLFAFRWLFSISALSIRKMRSSSSIGTPKLFWWPDVKPNISSVSFVGNSNFVRSTLFSSTLSFAFSMSVVCGGDFGNLRRRVSSEFV